MTRTEAAQIGEWRLPFPVDVRLTLSVHGRGKGDPTFRVEEGGAVWRTSLTPDGPATIRILPAIPAEAVGPGPDPGPGPGKPRGPGEPGGPGPGEHRDPGESGCRVTAHAWGPGAGWILDALPAALGLYDDISGFAPEGHPVLRDAARRHPGLRIGRTGRLMEALVPAILGQKVVSLEACRAWAILLAVHGTTPPGPAPRGMRVFPGPRTWRSIPSWDWHKAGVESVRAQTIIRAATVAATLERLLDPANPSTGNPGAANPDQDAAPNPDPSQHQSPDADPNPNPSADPNPDPSQGQNPDAARKLQAIPGIGPWTAAETLQRAAGDPDAVSVGDYHLPTVVGWALARREKTDDTQMLELLAPYKGHRYRVTRLAGLAGGPRPPRRGPRLSARDYRAF